ncbi:hypothetical protein PHYBOEH_006023 [Phytophthora boehmeriae]|uniref:Vacuolar protein 8 n=1 Tax=Phytophthora boehmeriae TaxID=109152 RepID=A0A8T1WKJ7_9STRA|nr:hypothetical protein PHYBOEH_006023 [Phytophthora boehmeriae]
MGVMLDMHCPGSGIVVEALSTLLEISNETQEIQYVTKSLHDRLESIFDELHEMEANDELPDSEALVQYTSLVSKCLERLKPYSNEKSVLRVLQYRQMMDEIYSFNEEIDSLIPVLHLTMAPDDWKKKYEEDQRTQQEEMSSMDPTTIIQAIGDVQTDTEAVHLDVENCGELHDTEVTESVDSAESTVVQNFDAILGDSGKLTKVIDKWKHLVQHNVENTITSEITTEPLGDPLQDRQNEPTLNAAAESVKMDNDNDIAEVTSDGGIPSLVALLRAGADEQQCQAASALMALADRDATNRVEIARLGAIPPLVVLLRSGTDGQKSFAAGALGNLANGNDANRTEIAGKGAILPLITLLRTGNDEQKLHAAGALGNLANNNDANRIEIAREGATSPLVVLLQSGTDEQKLFAARALGNLAHNNDTNRAEIAREQAIPTLVELVKGGTKEHRHSGAYALGKLAGGNDSVRLKIVDAASIPPLVALLRDGDEEQKLIGLYTLSGLCEGSESVRAEIKRHGLIPLLDAIVHVGTDAQKEYANYALSQLNRPNPGSTGCCGLM